MTLIEILLVSVAIGVVWAWKKDREINFSNTLKVGSLVFLVLFVFWTIVAIFTMGSDYFYYEYYYQVGLLPIVFLLSVWYLRTAKKDITLRAVFMTMLKIIGAFILFGILIAIAVAILAFLMNM